MAQKADLNERAKTALSFFAAYTLVCNEWRTNILWFAVW